MSIFDILLVLMYFKHGIITLIVILIMQMDFQIQFIYHQTNYKETHEQYLINLLEGQII